VPTPPVNPDIDADGVPGAIEALAPNGGDGNNDGTPDAQQADVATIHAATGAGFVTIDAQGHSLANVRALRGAAPADGGLALPQGLFGFEVHNVALGGSTDVRLILPESTRPEVYLKEDASGALALFTFDGTTGAEINDNVITLHLVDGGRGDADGVAN